MFNLDTDITKISRVGKATAKKLAKIGIKNVNDLLFYFPYRYDDYRTIMPIKNLRAGERANVVGQIELIQNKRSWRKRMYITEALVSDATGEIKVIWFNQPFIARNLKSGDKVSLAGKVDSDFSGFFLTSPTYEKNTTGYTLHTQGIVPNYHLTSNLTQKQIRFLIKQVINVANLLPDPLPREITARQNLIYFGAAIKKIHFPKNFAEVEEAKKRLAFDEFFYLQLRSQLIKKEMQKAVAPRIYFKEKETKALVAALPFILTAPQKKAAWEILQDLDKDKPMSRLLEGDVGSGKTIVALIAMFNTALNKKQSVLMAPTEILAEQHYDTACKLFTNHHIKIGLTTGSTKKMNFETGIINDAKKKIKSMFITQHSDIIIGTHALIQEDIKFKDLSLAIIDEQHRFGVEQRKILVEKSRGKLTPHLLSLTATPIPRTLALALYGDLDLSIINQLPAGRQPILTKVVAEEKRPAAYNFIREQIKNGRQAFVICPLIDISDKLGVKSVKEEYKKLNEQTFPDLEIGMMHGKLSAKEKKEIMQRFKNNKIKIIVSTSVVEVGIDIPNATIMMIEGADRFGLAQLHQFRGRVGRDKHQSYCFLFTSSTETKTKERLAALEKYRDGFALAKIDLKFRGPGELYGTSQAGFPELKIASLFDYELIKKARAEVEKIIATGIDKYPQLLKQAKKSIEIMHLE